MSLSLFSTYLGRIIVHVVYPAVPSGINLLDLDWEPFAVVSVLNGAPLILVLAVEAFVVTIALAVSADM